MFFADLKHALKKVTCPPRKHYLPSLKNNLPPEKVTCRAGKNALKRGVMANKKPMPHPPIGFISCSGLDLVKNGGLSSAAKPPTRGRCVEVKQCFFPREKKKMREKIEKSARAKETSPREKQKNKKVCVKPKKIP